MPRGVPGNVPKGQDHPLSITVPCPVCFSVVSQPCTVPTDTGQRVVRWFHSRRTQAALDTLRDVGSTA